MNSINLKWSIDYYEANTKECDERLKSLNNFNEIPIVSSENLDHFKDGDLVRYQGMVQDMLNPEYYYSSYSLRDCNSGEVTERSGKYRDIAPCKENEELNLDGKVPGERLVFYCIPLPGMSKWVQNALKKLSESKMSGNTMSNKKRPIEEDPDEKMEVGDSMEGNHINKSKRVTEESRDAEGSQNESHSSEKYFPLNEKDGLPCIVKVYEKEDKCGIVLNDRIEVIGFLSLNPALESTWEDSDPEDKALHPPPSLVPRIHAIFTRKLVHSNPLLSQNIDSSKYDYLRLFWQFLNTFKKLKEHIQIHFIIVYDRIIININCILRSIIDCFISSYLYFQML
ncbi:UNVERIFIED_CONTAM: hypothetical protein PYX00_007039 [Menopon gallinae]|uniref:Mini-chromosome maintenance complex-binding protein n=1 Tax=Menopon gallinae TaxID=328185 RepID=A0AAW2HHG6_9NEOP